MRRALLLTTVILTAISCPQATAQVSSQVTPQLARGTHDLSLELSPDFEGVTGDTLRLDVGYGRFVRDRLAVRFSALYETIEDVAPGEKDYRAREITVAIEYTFTATGRLCPYAGIMLGYRQLNYLDIKDSAAIYGPVGGLKLFLADNVALDLSFDYALASAEVFVNDFRVEDSDIRYGLGFRVMF